MRIEEHKTIRDLGSTDPALLPFFSPLERAIIEVCRKVIEESEVNKNGN